MSILIVGLGSMGKRRIRCLQALGYTNIYGYDNRHDRRQESEAKYGINVGFCEDPNNVFLSLPPSLHREYSERYKHLPTFIEAGTELLDHGTPSATMLFNPLVKIIQEKLPTIGKVINITYHCGQYLPDWHPYEKISDFYAAESGAIEMVAFELMWFTRLFGYPDYTTGFNRMGGEIEGLTSLDSLGFCTKTGHLLSTIMIDVVSRKPIRQLVINGTEKY